VLNNAGLYHNSFGFNLFCENLHFSRREDFQFKITADKKTYLCDFTLRKIYYLVEYKAFQKFGDSSNGRTADSESVCKGSTPLSPAIKRFKENLDLFYLSVKALGYKWEEKKIQSKRRASNANMETG
jgi:hypothetical protein